MKKLLCDSLVAMPSPVWVIGTYDSYGKPNLMPLSWGGIASTKPPCLSISVKNSRQTLQNIMQQNCFTVCIPSCEQIRMVDGLGLVSGKAVDKCQMAKLQMIRSSCLNAPYAEEFPLILACNVIHYVNIGSHTCFIGEIVEVIAEDTILDENNIPQIKKLQPLISAATDRSYYMVGKFLGKAYEIAVK